MRFAAKELEQTQYGINVVKGGATRDNFSFPTCVKGVVAVPGRLEVGEDYLEIVDRFCYFDDVISCGGGVELAVRDRISSVIGVNGGNWQAC